MDKKQWMEKSCAFQGNWMAWSVLSENTGDNYNLYFRCVNADKLDKASLAKDAQLIRDIVAINSTDASVKVSAPNLMVAEIMCIEDWSEAWAMFDAIAIHRVPPEFWEE